MYKGMLTYIYIGGKVKMSIIGIAIQLVALNESDILNCQNTIKLLSNVFILHGRLAQSTVYH